MCRQLRNSTPDQLEIGDSITAGGGLLIWRKTRGLKVGLDRALQPVRARAGNGLV
ncbi:hypothetical protein BDV11DRAFT_66630 [Aspergillus similis]